MSVDKKYKILIVDDDAFLLDMYALKFNQSGFEVATAKSGAEAMAHIGEKGAPDVVLLDILMPEMDGFEMLQAVRDKKAKGATRYIVLSNLGEPSDIEKARQLGADDYIVKATMTPSEVVAKAQEILKQPPPSPPQPQNEPPQSPSQPPANT